MRKRVSTTLLAVLVLPLLAGCPAEPQSSGAAGVVTSRWTEQARNSPMTIRYLTVDADHGPEDTGRVSEKVYTACKVGNRWPDCKRAAR
jgi:hypothetical protein